MTRFKHLVGDSALWVALVLVFGLVATVKIVAQSSPTCSYTYSSWGECRSDGTRVRTVQSVMPDECSGEPEIEESCDYTAPTCSYTYSSWGTCLANGKQTRTVQSQSPTGCEGSPEIERSCTYTAPTCAFTYSSWGACQSNGTMMRTVLTATPSGCTGTPQTSQTCTYSTTSGSTTSTPTCAFTYSPWSDCLSSGKRTRTVVTSTPSGCVGNPDTSESCTYTSSNGTTVSAPTCTYVYSAWGNCSSNGIQTRTILSYSPTGCVGSPKISQSCTSSGVTSTLPVCAYTYSSWGLCQSNGLQTRGVLAQSPSNCSGNPEVNRSCAVTINATSTNSSSTTSSTAPICAYTYSPWGMCQSNGTQTRSALSKTPSNCVGDPYVSQFCTYSAGANGNTTTAPVCAFSYTPWSSCSSAGLETRSVISRTPSNCVGTPDVSRSCASSSGISAPACVFTYSPWISCQSNGMEMRSVASQVPQVCAGRCV